MPVRKNVNKDFFKTWTPEMAYVLGFFFADGSYDVNKRGGEYFSFQIADKDLLVSIRSALNSNHKIAARLPRAKGEQTQYRIQIGSKEMCFDLRVFGVTTQKAHTARFPDVPKAYLSDFIRGYFDGDGNVWSGLLHPKRAKRSPTIMTMFTSCSENFLRGLQSVCVERGMGPGSFFMRERAFRLQYSQKDSIILNRIMYRDIHDSNLLLKRKKIIFDTFMLQKTRR